MQEKQLSELEANYELELKTLVQTIKKQKSKKVLIQLPELFKPYATKIQDKLQELLNKEKPKISCDFFIWLDTCFGACDIPLETEKLGIDLIVQFGHTVWDYSKNNNICVVE